MKALKRLLTLLGIPTKKTVRRPSPEQLKWAFEVFDKSASSETIPRKQRGRSIYSGLSRDDRRRLQLKMQGAAGMSPNKTED